MTTKTKVIGCRVDEKTKQAFNEMANNHGLTESELLGLILNGTINETTKQNDKQNNSKILPQGKILTKAETELKQITLRMPLFIMTAAETKAKAHGMATSRWIKSLVQSNIIQPPVLIDSAIIALKETDRGLAAIGNNINQIARRLNESVFKTDMVRIEILEEVKQEIKAVRLSIDELIRVSRDGWSIDND
jgi:antitoxin component of RelBE/YafQ-DinJ toxin-antitoxin module